MKLVIRTAAFSAVIALGMQAQAPAAKPAPPSAKPAAAKPATAAKAWKTPRTADGQPDLQGVWSNASFVPLERPASAKGREFYTKEEAEALMKAARERGPAENEPGTVADVHYDLTQYGLDRSNAEADINLRTSLITDPKDGKVPPALPAVAKRVQERNAFRQAHQWDSAENRPLAERCILWGNEGPPMLPQGYNSHLQITQGKGFVAITQEMIHDTRIIPLDGRPHLPENIKQYFGDSRGHWEGDTLVVDTTNFTDKTAFRNSGEKLHVVERFTRTGPEAIKYEFTVSDPETWERSWSAEVPFQKTEDPLYEYACHEGNYGMANILSGVRATEKAAAAKK